MSTLFEKYELIDVLRISIRLSGSNWVKIGVKMNKWWDCEVTVAYLQKKKKWNCHWLNCCVEEYLSIIVTINI